MGNTVVVRDAEAAVPDKAVAHSEPGWEVLQTLLMPLASLKLTVALFAMAIFIVFAGTLAQAEMDIWAAIDSYFRTPIAWIDLQIFFPPAFFPSHPHVPGKFPFPGGWLIGLLMVVNLLAAHGLRFKIQASGTRLAAGLLLLVLGAITTYLVIASGSNQDAFQHAAWVSWDTLWILFKVALTALWLVSCYGWLSLFRAPNTERWLLVVSGSFPVLLGAVLAWLLVQGDAARLGDSGMRILWQLIKGTAAGLVLLAGCVLVFRKRAGIVLLHGGILLMMFNELLVGTMAEEAQMQIREGETVNFARDIRQVELAVIDRSDPNRDDVVAIRQSKLVPGRPIDYPSLPCRIEVVEYFRNSMLHPVQPGAKNLATSGAGLTRSAMAARPVAGADAGGGVDMASAYVKFTAKDGSALGTYLLSQFLGEQELSVGDKTYQVSLRFKQIPKDYAIQLVDVRKDDYLGTDTPRNYSSDVRVIDEARGINRPVRIWMNNPLRYAGETFYQSRYDFDPQSGVQVTGLQVVTNAGWMIPYVACMIVATGMLAQFTLVLSRFLNRRSASEQQRQQLDTSREPKKSSKRDGSKHAPSQSWPDIVATYLPLTVVLLFAMWLVGRSRVSNETAGAMDLYAFGKLPLVEQGRVKPFETLARNSLRIISNGQTFEDAEGNKQPAIRWLLDVIARPGVAENHRVFRIENMEVLDTLGLERRKGLRYAIAEFRPKAKEFNEQVEKARGLNPRTLSVYQRKLLELDRRIRQYTLLDAAFRTVDFPAMPTEEEFNKDREGARSKLMQIKQKLEMAARLDEMLSSMHPPLAVPVSGAEGDKDKRTWEPFSTAWVEAFRHRIAREEPNDATVHLARIFNSYAHGKTGEFNAAVAAYSQALAANPPVTDLATGETVHIARTNFEAFFDNFQPFLLASVMYLIAFVIACAGWLGWSGPLNRTSFALLVLTLCLHTFALAGRIYISGRPPVTNLYSSAVFIGWGCCVLALVLEVVYRLGIGNVVAGLAGFSTLLIAHFLAADGDTFTVLQAVLDTQFWLATHVVCISLGYATTFVAGLLGVLYILMGVFTPSLKPSMAKDLTRMIYGIVCFAIFFSFVGTVLGGLWADDSWGRFWGWDPKENGALIIVLWNALVLHARWDGMVRERGLANLAVGGNIATSWSWFGVNELGVGLHSYGFTEGVLLALGLFVLSQLAIIAIGLVPTTMWRSRQELGVAPARA